MVQEFGFTVISDVLDNWEFMKQRNPNYEKDVGVLLLNKLLELEPDIRTVLKLDSGCTSDDEAYQNKAKWLIRMLDSAISMLGPDVEIITEILRELGGKHAHAGATPEQLHAMVTATIHAMEQSCGKDFAKDSFRDVLTSLVADMICGGS